MKLATWNLWWRFGQRESRERAIHETIDDLDADVIALQEVWHTSTDSLASTIAKRLGYEHAFAPSPKPQKWQRRTGDNTFGIGNAVLSRWPIEATHTTRLPPGDAPDEGRIALHTTIRTPHGTLPFTSLHLNSGWGQSSIRSEQLRVAARHLAAQPRADFPHVMAGDFNAAPDFDEVRALAGKTDLLVPDLALVDAWPFVHPSQPGHTWDQRNPHVQATHEPSARIDYIFAGLATGEGLGKPLEAGLFGTSPTNGIWPSDHFGVWTCIQTPRSPETTSSSASSIAPPATEPNPPPTS